MLTSKWLGICLAILAGLQFIAGAANLRDLLSDTTAGWFVLIVGALQVAMSVYVGRTVETQRDVDIRRLAGKSYDEGMK